MRGRKPVASEEPGERVGIGSPQSSLPWQVSMTMLFGRSINKLNVWVGYTGSRRFGMHNSMHSTEANSGKSLGESERWWQIGEVRALRSTNGPKRC